MCHTHTGAETAGLITQRRFYLFVNLALKRTEKAEDLLVFPNFLYSEVSCHLMLANAMEREASGKLPEKAFSFVTRKRVPLQEKRFFTITPLSTSCFSFISGATAAIF